LSLPNNPAPSQSSASSISNLSGFENTQAAHLFDGTPPSSSNAIPPINFRLPNFPGLSNASSKTLDTAQITASTKLALTAEVQNLKHDVSLLTGHGQEMRSVVLPLVAQVALLTLENENLRTGLFLKEGRKISPQGHLFPGGTGTLATSNDFMDEQALMDGEKEQTKMKKATAQAELATRKVLWARARVEWEKRRQALVAAGRSKGEAGKSPLLCDIHLDNSPATSTALVSSAEIVQDSRKGKGRQHSPSIDSLMGEEIDLGESESEEDSEAWSVHDESDS
jgi:hypothetical protein